MPLMPTRKIFLPGPLSSRVTPGIVRARNAKRLEGLACDHPPFGACKTKPTHAVLIYVPSQTQDQPGHEHIRWPTPHTFCEAHWGNVSPDDFLTDRIKASIEAYAKKVRPLDFKCDFGFACHIVKTEIMSPGYMKYIQFLEVGRYGAAEKFADVVI